MYIHFVYMYINIYIYKYIHTHTFIPPPKQSQGYFPSVNHSSDLYHHRLILFVLELQIN
jgi:hypothetical protein